MAPPRKNLTTFSPPTSVEEAERTRLRIIEEIVSIRQQLIDRPDSTIPDWRRRAVSAIKHRKEVIVELEKWIAKNRKPLDNEGNGLLHRALYLLNTLAEEDVDFDEEEHKLINEIQSYLER